MLILMNQDVVKETYYGIPIINNNLILKVHKIFIYLNYKNYPELKI